jgi:hypothetical protein
MSVEDGEEALVIAGRVHDISGRRDERPAELNAADPSARTPVRRQCFSAHRRNPMRAREDRGKLRKDEMVSS